MVKLSFPGEKTACKSTTNYSVTLRPKARGFVKILDRSENFTIEAHDGAYCLHIGYVAEFRDETKRIELRRESSSKRSKAQNYFGTDFSISERKVWVYVWPSGCVTFKKEDASGKIVSARTSDLTAVFRYGYFQSLSQFNNNSLRMFVWAIRLTIKEWKAGNDLSMSGDPSSHEQAVKKFRKETVDLQQSKSAAARTEQCMKLKPTQFNGVKRTASTASMSSTTTIKDKAPTAKAGCIEVHEEDGNFDDDRSVGEPKPKSCPTSSAIDVNTPTHINRNGCEIPIMAGGFLQRMLFNND